MAIKVAIAGLGRIGQIHLENLLQLKEVEVVGATDPMAESLKFAELRGVNCYSTYDALLDESACEAVVICSPTDTHAIYSILAAKKGKHIFCEKPLDLSLQKVQEVVEVVQQHQTKLMLGFNRRFDEEFMKVKAHTDQGSIGEVHIVKITSRDPKAPPAEYIAHSGGIFLDMSIHDFDMARFIVGKEVVKVFAQGCVRIDPEIGKAGDLDTAIIQLTFSDDTIAVIDNSRQAVYGYDQRLEVFGSLGMVKAENRTKDQHELFTSSGVSSALPEYFFLERYANAYKNEMRSFIKHLAEGSEISPNALDGLQSLKIGLAAKLSVAENRSVWLDEITS